MYPDRSSVFHLSAVASGTLSKDFDTFFLCNLNGSMQYLDLFITLALLPAIISKNKLKYSKIRH